MDYYIDPITRDYVIDSGELRKVSDLSPTVYHRSIQRRNAGADTIRNDAGAILSATENAPALVRAAILAAFAPMLVNGQIDAIEVTVGDIADQRIAVTIRINHGDTTVRLEV